MCVYIYILYINIYITYIHDVYYIHLCHIYKNTRIYIFMYVYERAFRIVNLVSLLGKHRQPVLPSQGHEAHGAARGTAAQPIHGGARARRLGIKERPRESAGKILCTHTTHTIHNTYTHSQNTHARARAHTHTHTHTRKHSTWHKHTHTRTHTHIPKSRARQSRA
jgi:hypothetical protein